jgi:hypothetical protein
MKCTRIGGKRCNCSCFEIDQEMDPILLIIGIVYGVCWIVIKSVQQCTYFLFSVNLLLIGIDYGKRTMQVYSLSYHFSPFENEYYHRFIISLQANNLTSLSPYATDLTSDRSLDYNHILLIIGIVYGVCWIFIKSVQQCTYFLFSVNLLLVGVNYGQRTMPILTKKNICFGNW